ncbi:MAG: hypothetical protein WAQ05_22990, partial [Rubrivivax sp.]
MRSPPFTLAQFAHAAWAAALLAGSAHAAVTTTGAYGSSTGLTLGPGDTVLPSTRAWIGESGGVGSLTVDGGSFMQLAQLSFGSNGVGNGTGTISGAGTRVELSGDNNMRLGVANWGVGKLTIAAGAQVDTSLNQAPCMVQFHYCDSFVGASAGDSAWLTLTGAGSRLRVGQQLFIGAPILSTVPVNGFAWGVPGGTTTATVEVLDGAELVVDRSQVGTRQWSSGNTGFERSSSLVRVSGAGSRWVAVGGQQWDAVTGVPTTFAAGITTALDRYAVASIDIANGGELRIEGVTGLSNYVNLTNDRGRSDMVLRDAGSALNFIGDAGVLQVGRSLGSASLEVRAGAHVDNVWYTAVGRDGAMGMMTLDGAGTLFRANGTATAAANGGNTSVAVFDIGRGGGNGTVSLSNGARLELLATTATVNAPNVSIGRDAASAGTLNIGSGSTVFVSAASVAPDTAGEAWNPFVRIGRDGSGTLNVSGGGKLLVQGDAVSTLAFTRRTSLFVGGSGDTSIGGKGTATVSGTGSELRVSGSDAYIGVGHGPQAVGSLAVTNQAAVAATILGVGNYGATGIVKLDHASLTLEGQYTGAGEFGAALVIAAGNGAVGNFSASNGSSIVIRNRSGSNGGGVTLGGSRTLAGGDGSMTLSASSLLVDIASNGGLTVGRSGSGLLRLQNASTVDLGNSVLVVGRDAGSDGTVIATGASVINAGWVGVGRRQDGLGGSLDGGTATMVLNGATLNATDIVIGTNGYLGGTAGAINASGTVTNYGIFSPGNSPGTFTINGDFHAAAGSRLILEVQADGSGGFNTDLVQFGFGKAVDLAALNVEFRFLGNTDPNAFLASGGFDIDHFVVQADGGGAYAGLADAAWAGVGFSASAEAYTISSFSYSAAAGASFVAAPVPEPAPWLLLAGGLL